MSAGGIIFLSGQLPISADERRLHQEDFETQVRQTLANLDAALQAANSSRAALVQVRIYVVEIGDWPAFDRVYREWIGDFRPARAVVPVPTLHYGFRVEIEGVALQTAVPF